MKIIEVEQNSPEWLAYRHGKIMGSTTAEVQPLKRKNSDGNLVGKGFWRILAQHLTDYEDVASDENSANGMQRGHNLENENIEIAARKLKIPLKNVELNCGVWVSDDERCGVSPDGHEKSENPTFAFEAKALNAADHLKTVLVNRIWKGDLKVDDTKAMWDYIPDYAKDLDYRPLTLIEKLDYKYQALSYFKINPNLKKLYFCMYNPMFLKTPSYIHEIITIERKDVEEEIQDLINGESVTLDVIDQFIKLLGGKSNG